MNSREELIETYERILRLEKDMRDGYLNYITHLSDKELLKKINEIKDDEIRHINMAERIISILRK